MHDYQQEFIRLALARNALRFGEFTLKSGRISPYFFNAGAFDDGASLAVLGRCYAAAIAGSGVPFDMLFGPAYKGIPLVAVAAAALHSEHGLNYPWAFNRKEAKDHGEGGSIVGRRLSGRVLIIDDVITAGTAIRESIQIIRAAGAEPAGVALALDRQERGRDAAGNDLPESAVQEVRRLYGIPAFSILTLSDLIEMLRSGSELMPQGALSAMEAYRARYGCA
ncbi:MAG: orotate phosphoribosyltransferase [Pseudomonadota bacterium]|jgi:orotate phosphoribosyltransferase|nr:MAG: orotate phosphoribosyltransferase [Pseudomonadota bacterium]